MSHIGNWPSFLSSFSNRFPCLFIYLFIFRIQQSRQRKQQTLLERQNSSTFDKTSITNRNFLLKFLCMELGENFRSLLCHYYVPLIIIWLLKLSFDQNLMIINHKSNCDFKNTSILEGHKNITRGTYNISLKLV
jgi:hypothetical protein